jgi:fumarate reductase subunit D
MKKKIAIITIITIVILAMMFHNHRLDELRCEVKFGIAEYKIINSKLYCLANRNPVFWQSY